SAYLIIPAGEGRFPGIVYVHWYEGGNPTSNRTQFVDEAVWLAESDGVMSLLIETMWSDPNWYRTRKLEGDYDDAIRQVIELRRALDVLLAQPQIDPERIVYVGHDFGAMYGSLMAAVDHRPKAYVRSEERRVGKGCRSQRCQNGAKHEGCRQEQERD